MKVIKKVTILVLLLVFNLSFGCIGAQKIDYYGYMLTGEESYMIFKLELTDNKKENYLWCLKDDVLAQTDSDYAADFPGAFTTTNLSKTDVVKIMQALKKSGGTKFNINSLGIKEQKITFCTERLIIDENNEKINFKFRGVKKQKSIFGELYIYNSCEKYPNSNKIEFRQNM